MNIQNTNLHEPFKIQEISIIGGKNRLKELLWRVKTTGNLKRYKEQIY